MKAPTAAAAAPTGTAPAPTAAAIPEPHNAAAVDLNADVGEGFDDPEVMALVTSVSIACGGHAGDEATMRAALTRASELGLRVGAHPGYPDRANFGRVDMPISDQELRDAIAAQLRALAAHAVQVGARLTHAKAHGALYNRAWDDPVAADIVATAVAEVDPRLAIICPPGSAQSAAALRAGLRPLHEVFLDRRYVSGRLMPRGQPGAVMDHPGDVQTQVDALITEGVDTACAHGDNPAAVAVLRAARAQLTRNGVAVRPYSLS